MVPLVPWSPWCSPTHGSLSTLGHDRGSGSANGACTSGHRAAGFVPNYAAGGSKSVDRTEPLVGAKVLLLMHNKYPGETWLVRLLFDDLLGWNDWMARARTLGPLGIVSLGSDTIDGYGDYSAGAMQGARYESGLDNSPMYGKPRRTTNRIGRGRVSTLVICALRF